MSRIAAVVLASVVGLSLLPGQANAQFFIPNGSPQGSPLYPVAPYRFQPYVGVPANSVYGRVTIGSPIPWYNPLNNYPQLPALRLQNWYGSPNYGPVSSVPWGSPGYNSSGYLSGGVQNSNSFAGQQALAQAQRDAAVWATTMSHDSAKDLISDQWVYEKLGTVGLIGPKTPGQQADALIKALAVQDESEVASGEALNHVLAAILVAEAKGTKGPSAFLAPQLLADVQFGGGPAGDALNVLRNSGRLPFPTAFTSAELKDNRAALERDFAAAVAPLLTGKPADAAKLAKLELSLRQAQTAAAPVIRTLPFDEAAAASRFLNHFEAAIPSLKGSAAAGLVDSSWPTVGTSVADLVKHMNKHKLLFGPAPRGGETSYMALHKALVTYLLTLNQQAKK